MRFIKYLLIISVLTACSLSESSDIKKGEKHTEFHPNGALKLEGMAENGHRIGIWKAYFPSGELQTLANYNEAGKEEGMYKVYAITSGKHHLSYSGYYSNGERRGTWNFYNEQGIVVNTKSFTKSEGTGE